MAVTKEPDRTQWCFESEIFANCANCYRRECKKRRSSPIVGLPTATSLGQHNFSRGRHIMAGRGK